MKIIAWIQIKQGETIVCIFLQYKCFIAVQKKSSNDIFQLFLSDWFNCFIFHISFSLALNSGTFLLNSSHCYVRSFIWEILKKKFRY